MESASPVLSSMRCAPGFWVRRGKLILMFAVFAGAVAYFAWGASTMSPELGESQDIAIAKDYLTTFRIPVDQSPVYYLVLALWQKVGGTSVVFLRVPTIVAGGLAVLFIFLLMSAEVGTVGGLLAALLLATNSAIVFYSRSTRTYALVAAVAAICLWFLQRYVNRGRRWRDFTGLVAFSILGVYTHLFFLLFAGSLGLLILIDLIRHRPRWKMLLAMSLPAVFGLLAVGHQAMRVWRVTGYTESRYSVYHGLPHEAVKFFSALGHGLFRSGLEMNNQDLYVTAAFAVLVLIGMISLGWRGIVSGLAIFAPTLGVSYYLSATSAVWSRYIIYLVPPIAAFAAAPLAKLRRVWLWGPLAALVALQGVSAIDSRYEKPTDWPQAMDIVRQTKEPGDIVAVFPSFWRWTFQSYYRDDNFVPFYYPVELERLMARGRRIIVVQGPGRYAGHVSAFLKKKAGANQIFQTKIRDKITVYTVKARRPEATSLTPADVPSLLLTGVVSPGDYPWKKDSGRDNPFARLRPLFSSADLVLTPYAAYRTPTNLLSAQPKQFNLIEALANAGVRAVALLPALGEIPDQAADMRQVGLQTIPLQRAWQTAQPVMLIVKNQKVAILNVGQRVFTDRPNFRSRNDALVADWAAAVERARRAVGSDGRLIVFLPEAPAYTRLFTKEDQMIARLAIDLGADAVVGVGGWNAQEVESYKNGIIAYSLGTLLRPPSLGGPMRYSTGTVMRLRFPPGLPAQFDLVPVLFDDTYRAALAPPDEADYLPRRGPSDPSAEYLYDHLIDARVTFTSRDGKRQSISRWETAESSFSGILAGFKRLQPSQIAGWVNTQRPIGDRQEGYFGSGYYAAVGGSISMGQFRRALRLRAPTAGKIEVTFPARILGHALRVVYGVDDSNIGEQHLGNPPQRLSIAIDGTEVQRQRVEFAVGWNTLKVNTEGFQGREGKVSLTLETSTKANFLVSVDAVILRSPDVVRRLVEGPYKFDEHLDEAAVSVVGNRGARSVCRGPDETFRLLRGGKRKVEENGPYGEGVLFHRWYCGPLPWDSVGLTRQRSGGELRPAIWLHPLADRRRVLTYGPLPLGRKIRGYYGITDLAARIEPQPVTFAILVGGRKIFRVTVSNEAGWREFSVDLPSAWFGRMMDVTFVSETSDDKWRHFLFDAVME